MAESRREWMLRMMEMWNSGEYERFVDDLGPDVVFSPDPSFTTGPTAAGGRWHLATRGSGDEVPLADFSFVMLFADETAERPHRWAVFFDHDRAAACQGRYWLTRQSMGVCSDLRDLVA